MKAISEKLGFDINDYYAFIELTDATRKDPNTRIKSLYRYFGSKKISEDFLEKEFSDKINPTLFYSRVDIENLSQKIECSVFDRNEFKSYIIINYLFPELQISFDCVREGLR